MGGSDWAVARQGWGKVSSNETYANFAGGFYREEGGSGIFDRSLRRGLGSRRAGRQELAIPHLLGARRNRLVEVAEISSRRLRPQDPSL